MTKIAMSFLVFVPTILLCVGLLLTSFARLRILSLIPFGMLALGIGLIYVDDRCEGNGFTLSWINCEPELLDGFAQGLAGLFYINLFACVFLAPLGLVALVIAELIQRRKLRTKA